MAVYSYNGWKAQDIQTVVDMDATPYACIVAASDLLVAPMLLYSAHRPVLRPAPEEYADSVSNVLTWLAGETWYGRESFGADGEPRTWGDAVTYCGDDGSEWYTSLLCLADCCVWTNFDIYDEDGNLVYEKSPDPILVPEDTRDKRSFCLGIALSMLQHRIFVTPSKPPYIFDPDAQTLILNSDDGSLSFGFSTDTFQMDVEEV